MHISSKLFGLSFISIKKRYNKIGKEFPIVPLITKCLNISFFKKENRN